MTRRTRPPGSRFLAWVLVMAAIGARPAVASEPSKPAAPPLTAAQKERLKERDRFGEEAQKLQAAGKLDEAVQAAEAMLAIEREVLGPDSDDAIGSLVFLGRLHLAREGWTAARAIRREAFDRLTARLGRDHWRVAEARLAVSDVDVRAGLPPDRRRCLEEAGRLDAEVSALYGKGRYQEAIGAARRSLTIHREVLGERHPDTITSLSNLAQLLFARGDYKAARPMFERALELYGEVLGRRHPNTITCLSNLGVVLYAQADYKAARTMYERALELRREILGERHPDTLWSLANLAGLLRDRGDYKAARPMFERALELRREILGERHPDTLSSLGNLGSLMRKQGDLMAARPLYERALELRREILGERHPDTITSLSNLARLLEEQGNLRAARPMLERVLELRVELLGERHPSTLAAFNNLAGILMSQGDLKAARPMYERALELRREILGERHADTIASLANLAQVLEMQGDLEAARSLYERALGPCREVMGERHPDTLTILNNLAHLLAEQGNLKAARPLYERALELRREVLGERHPDTLSSLNNLASLLWQQGDFGAARPLYERALELFQEVRGEHHPSTITVQDNLATLLLEQGDSPSARALVERALGGVERLAGETLLALTEREQFAYLGSVRKTLDFDLALTGGDGAAYRHILSWKGVIAQSAAARAVARSPAARGLLAELAPLRARLNAVNFARVPADRAADFVRATRSLADQIARKESELARAVGWKIETLDPAAVADAVPDQAAMVDLIRYRHTSRSERTRTRFRSEDRYAAFVVRKGEPPVRVDLGPAAPIEEALAAWRERLQGGQDAEESGRVLAKLVWEPIRKHLGDARTVLVSPDWQLSFLPWAALPDQEPGSFLIRRYTFGTIISARQLVEMARSRATPAAGGLLAVGGVDYGKADTAPAAVVVATRAAAVERGSLAFGPLPATADEVAAVAVSYRKAGLGRVEQVSGSAATRERVRAAMVGRRYLHLATHGFFAPPEVKSALAPDDAPTGLKSWEGMSRGEARGFYPGLLSGLVWAGAARPPRDKFTGTEDVGACLMTAEEVESIDLKGCELAVLSACETGLGATAGGEGVKGLQSAFHQAGCRAVVASLWRVDDAATRALMSRFYANLWEKKRPVREALREAQIAILDDPDLGGEADPRLWAAWVLSGGVD